MATLDSEMFQTLLKELKVMNRNLETASAAIHDLTNQLTTEQEHSAPGLGSAPESIQFKIARSGNGAGDQVIQAKGYVNWVDQTHKKLGLQSLVKVSTIRSALDALKAHLGNVTAVAHSAARNDYGTNNRALTNSVAGKFSFSNLIMQNVCVINKESRFPLDAVYVDVDDPKIKKEIIFFNNLNTLPTDGVVERFVAIVEQLMHTCATFEKLHQLEWH